MKYLFACIAIVLGVSGLAIRASYPDLGSDVPVLYWVTDRNPARADQVAGFHRWLIANGHCTEVRVTTAQELQDLLDGLAPTLLDDMVAAQPELGRLLDKESPDTSLLPAIVLVPLLEMRIDTANSDDVKQTIQSVSGVGGDVMDVLFGSGLRKFESMGVLVDLTEDANAMGFGVDQTYPSLAPEITIDGRQFAFPCNANSDFLWVNPRLFEDNAIPAPPKRWTLEEFESLGVAFCAAANRAGERRQVFFLDRMPFEIVARSLGVSVFNETMTASTLDDPGYAEMLDLAWRWMYDLNILPTPDDEDSFSVSQGYKGAKLQLFGAGNYAMVLGGRYFLLQFRAFEALGEFAAVEIPHGGFPNTNAESRLATIYKGSEHPELAKLFLAYLTSEGYNRMIVDSADALPPNPAFTQDTAYLRPPDHPKEWGVHGVAAEAALSLAVANEYSPFVLPTVVVREVEFVRDEFLIGRLTSAQAAARTAAVIDQEIRREIARKPGLRPEYDRRLSLQERIDARKAKGERIPENWVLNPFLRAYYGHTDRLTAPEPVSIESDISELANPAVGGSA
ncbi:MAG: extracellular solute-binding protein [Planctomycetota bacterium]